MQNEEKKEPMLTEEEISYIEDIDYKKTPREPFERYFSYSEDPTVEEDRAERETQETIEAIKWLAIIGIPVLIILGIADYFGIIQLCQGTNTQKNPTAQVYVLSQEEKDALCFHLNHSDNVRSVYNDGQCAVLVNKDVSSKEELEKILGNGCRVQDILVGKDGRTLASANCQGLDVTAVVKKLQEAQAKHNAIINTMAMNQRGLGM